MDDGAAMTTVSADSTATTVICVNSISGFAVNQYIDLWDSDTAPIQRTIASVTAEHASCSNGPAITVTAAVTTGYTVSKNATVARSIWKQRIIQGAVQTLQINTDATVVVCVQDNTKFAVGGTVAVYDNNSPIITRTISSFAGTCASGQPMTLSSSPGSGTYTTAQSATIAEVSATLSNSSAPSDGAVIKWTSFNHPQNPTDSVLLSRTTSVSLAYAKSESPATSATRYPYLSNRHIFFVAYGDADTTAPADGDIVIVGNGKSDPDSGDSSNLTNDLNWSEKESHVVTIDRSWDAALAYSGTYGAAVGEGAGSRANFAAWSQNGGWVSALVSPGSQLGLDNSTNKHYRIAIPGKIVADSDALVALGKTGAAIPSSSGHDIYFDTVSPAASTLFTVDSAASATLTVASTTNFMPGDTIVLDDNNSVPTTRIIAAVENATTITLTAAAVTGYTVAQGAFIAKGSTTELPTGQDRRAGIYTMTGLNAASTPAQSNTRAGRVALYADGSEDFRTEKSDLAVDIEGDIDTGYLGNNLADSGNTWVDVRDDVGGDWQPLDQISVAGGTNQVADNIFSSPGLGGSDDANQMPLWTGAATKVDTGSGGRNALPTPNMEVAEVGTIPLTNIYNANYNGGTPLYSSNYNNTSAWTIFNDGANTEVNDAVYFGDQGDNMPYALEVNLGTTMTASADYVWEYYKSGVGWTAFLPRDAYQYSSRTGVVLPLSVDTVNNSLTATLAEGGTVFGLDQIVMIDDNDSDPIYRRLGTSAPTATTLTFSEPIPSGYTVAQGATVSRLNGGQWQSSDPASFFTSGTGRKIIAWTPDNLNGAPAKTTVNGINAFWVRARISSFTSWTTSPTNQTTPVGMSGIERMSSGFFNVSSGVQEAKISEITPGVSFNPNENYILEYGDSPGWTQIVPIVPAAPFTWHINSTGMLSQNTATADFHISNGDFAWDDYTVTAKVRMRTATDATSRKIGIVLRNSLDGNGYGALIEKTSTVQRIGLYPMALGAEGTVFGNTTKTFTDNNWFWIKANVSGTGAATVLSAKFWADGSGEPGSWDVTYTTNAAQGLWNTGRIGLFADAMIADFDDVSVDDGSVVLADTFSNTGNWKLRGSINGDLGTVTPGTPFAGDYLNFTLKQKGGWNGTKNPEIGDKIYISSTSTKSYKGISGSGNSAITTSDTNTVYENIDFEWDPGSGKYDVTGSASGTMGAATPGSAFSSTGGEIGLTIPSGAPTATKFGDRMLLLQDNYRRNNGSWIGNNGHGSAVLVWPSYTLTSSTITPRYNIEGQSGTNTARQNGTIDFWFKTNYDGSPSYSTHPKGMYLFDQANQGNTDRLLVRHTPDGYLEAAVFAGTAQGTLLRQSFSATAGQWHHFRLAWDETLNTKRAWLDGTAFSSGQASVVGTRGANAGIIRIGNAWTYDAPFDGSIDEFAIFDDAIDTSGSCNWGDFTAPSSVWTNIQTAGCDDADSNIGTNIFRASFDQAMNPQEGSIMADYAFGLPSMIFTNGADTGNERIRVVTYPARTRVWVDNTGEKYTPSARIKFGSGYQENATLATLAGWSHNFTYHHKAARQSETSPTYSPVLNLKRSTHIWSPEPITQNGATMGAPINAGMGYGMGTIGLSGLGEINFSDVSIENQYTDFAIVTNPFTSLAVKPSQTIANSVFYNYYDRAYTVSGKTQGTNYVGADFVTTHFAAANVGNGYNAGTSQNVGIDGSIFMGCRNAYVTAPPAAANGAAAFYSGRLYSVQNSEFYNNGITGLGTSGALNFGTGVAKVDINDNIFSLNTNGIRLYGNAFVDMEDNIFEGHVSDSATTVSNEYGSGIRAAQSYSSVAVVDKNSIFGRGLWNESDINLPPNTGTFEAESLLQFTGENTQLLSPALFGTADYSNMNRIGDEYLTKTIPGVDIRATYSDDEKDIVNFSTFGLMRTSGPNLTDTTVRTSGGYGWRMEPTDPDVSLEYPVKLVGVAGKPLAATGYIRLNSNYGSTNLPTVTLSGLGMSGANLTWTAQSLPDEWQQFVVSGTPTESALAELKISTKLDYVTADSGTSELISNATGNYLPAFLEDNDKSWTPNQWVGYKLRDVNGKIFEIVKNTDKILYLKGMIVPHLLSTTFSALTTGDYIIYSEPYLYLDDVSVLSGSVDTGTLDFYSAGQPVSPWLSTGLTAEGVWNAQWSSFSDSDGSFGQLLGDSLVAQYANVSDPSPSVTEFDTNLESITDDFYNNGVIAFTEGPNKGVVRRISDYAGASKTITVDPALPFAPSDDNRFAIISATASASSSGGGATAAEIWAYVSRTLTDATLDSGSLATDEDVSNIRSDIAALNDISASDVWAYADKTITGVTSDGAQDIWDTACAILNTSGSVGKLVCDNLDAKVSEVGGSTLTAEDVWTYTTRTITGLENPALSAIANSVWANATRELTSYGNDITAQDVWDVLTSSLTTIDSIGELLVVNVDEEISSRASQASVDAMASDLATVLSEIGTGNISAIKTSTDTIDWSDITGLISTSGEIKLKTDSINWADIGAIKTSTDTIDWDDITQIKLKTDTINWGDITDIKGDVATLLTEIGTGNISAIKTKTDSIDWSDITGLITSSGDIKLRTDTIDWTDVDAIKTKSDTIDWDDVTGIKLKTDTIDWTDVDVISSRVDTTVSSRASQDSLNTHESAEATFRTNTTNTLSDISTDVNNISLDVSAINGTLSIIEGKIDTISSTLGTIDSKIDTIDTDLASVKTTVEDTGIRVSAIQTVTNNILNKWGSYTAADIIGYVDALESYVGNPDDGADEETLFGKIVDLKDSVGSGGTIDLIYTQVQASYEKLLDVQMDLGFSGKSTVAYDEIMAIKTYVDSLENSLATLDSRTSNISSSVNDVSDDLKDVTDQIGKVDSDSLAPLLEIKKSDIDYLKNKVLELKAVADVNRQLLEQTVNQPVVKVMMEWGSVIIKFIIANPSDSIDQKIPFKAFLPKEVKQEYIIDQGGLSLNYDATTEQYYVTADVNLKAGEAVVRSVEIKDVWIIPNDEIESLKKQTEEMVSVLGETAYTAQAITLKTDINTRLDRVMRKQKDSNATPQDHILAFRENQEEMKAVNENIKAIQGLMIDSGAGKNFLASIGGMQTFATWGIVLILIFGMGALGFFYYALWRKRIISENNKDFEELEYFGNPEEYSSQGLDSVHVQIEEKIDDAKLPTPSPWKIFIIVFVWAGKIISRMIYPFRMILNLLISLSKRIFSIFNRKVAILIIIAIVLFGGVLIWKYWKDKGGVYKKEEMSVLELLSENKSHEYVAEENVDEKERKIAEAVNSIDEVAQKNAKFNQEIQDASISGNFEGEKIKIKNTEVGWLNVRSEPSKAGSVVAKVYPTEEYEYAEKRDGWYNILLENDKKGWVIGEYVELVQSGLKEDNDKDIKGNSNENILTVKNTPTGWLNVREDASIGSASVAKIYPEEEYVFFEVKNNWYKITTKDGVSGWVIGEYVKAENVDFSENSDIGNGNTSLEDGSVVVVRQTSLDFVNVYEEPAYTGKIISQVYPGEDYSVLEVKNAWYRVALNNDQKGWVLGEYLEIKNKNE